MTTLLYDRDTKTIGVDSRNTDSSGQAFTCNKIERLSNRNYFLGSGHLMTIGVARRWAETDFDEEERPEFGVMFDTELREDYSFSCLIISQDGERTWLLDDELEPIEIFDGIIGLGSGGGYAAAARMAGASVAKAIEIAIHYDSNSGGPVRTCKIGEKNEESSIGMPSSYGGTALLGG